MKRKTQIFKLIIMLIMVFSLQKIIAQDYKTDSLQIKSYTEIAYSNGQATSIKLKKVFCDYCSDNQLVLLGEEALRRANLDKYDPKNRIDNGNKRVAIYIRIAKTDFAGIKEEN